VDKEILPREDMQKLQLSRLQSLCERVYANVPHYRKAFDEKGVHPSDIRSLDDISLLPFTGKQDLRDAYPFGMLAVPREVIVRLHASSGTTGKATVVGYTKRDLDIWAECMARNMSAASMTCKDLLHNAYGYGLFTGGARRTLRRGATRRNGHTRVRRGHQTPGIASARLWRNSRLLHAILYSFPVCSYRLSSA
jgi:phenylacetate-CoA ligase